MASDPETLSQLLAGELAGTEGLSEEIARLADQLRQLQTASEAATTSKSVDGNSREAISGSGSGGSTSGALLHVFEGGLGIGPLISGLASLFGAGGEDAKSGPAAVPLMRFVLPPSIHIDAGMSESGGRIFAVDHPQRGLPRATPVQMAPQQITVQVQAIDSQSFLDHSADIAIAVRQAMLESSVLNDVIREA